MKNYISTLAFLFCCTLGIAQQTPAADQQNSILILGATAHIGDGTLLENSAIGLRDGKSLKSLQQMQYKINTAKLLMLLDNTYTLDL